MQPEFGDVAEPGVGTTEFDLGAQLSTPEIPVVPETGVPGIDSVDAFCRDWSDFTGPYFARASAADGIVDADVREALAASWIAQLAEQGVDDPFLDVDFAGWLTRRCLQLPLSRSVRTSRQSLWTRA